MSQRRRLEARRACETIDVEALGLKFKASIGFYSDGTPGEVFISNHRVNSMAGIMASDAAVAASLALQYGVPLDELRHALMRDVHGRPTSPLGVTLDRLAEDSQND